MDENTFSKLAICRTCLDTEANMPIFTDGMDTASYSGLVYTVTGVKVEIDDGLPQSICQNCINNINNCLHFRKQCKEAETKLMIMKNKIDHDIEIKLENGNTNIGIENLSSNELEQNEITQITDKTEIKKEVNVTVGNNINDNYENFGNKKNNTKADQMKDLRNVSVHKQKDYIMEINRVGSMVINFNNVNLINKSFNPEIDKRQSESINESMLYTSKNNDTSNTNSENENLSNSQNNIPVNKSITTENENFYDKKKYDNLINKFVDSEVDNSTTNNNIAATENANVWNDKQTNNKLTNKSLTVEVKNCFTNTQKVGNCFNDRQKVENCFNNKQKVENCFNNKQRVGNCSTAKFKVENCFNATPKVENCFMNTQKVENCAKNTQKAENFINDEQIKTEMDETKMENILYNYNDTNLRRVTCKLCQKDLSIRSVDSHMTRSHPGADKRRIKCDLCDNYVMKSKLLRHKTLMHGAQGFMCRFCKTEFVNKEALIEHIGSCSAKKKQRNCAVSQELGECEVCHKTMQKGSLKLHHAMKHAGLRPVCEHCGKSFGNKFRLQDHYRAKHGYEKYKCSYCDFQSAASVSIRNHERRHRGEKPFVCESCGAKFHASYLLCQHRQSHATDKAFQCDLCPASFKVNNTLHMHKRACHSTCKYACTMCTRTYSTRHYVVKHMRAMHRYTGPVPPLTPVEC